ncbi:MAG: bifunctional precorrin-2 dehydrogenase/sirohydrochlorin ferrochelatase [Candidatus Omnitrophica bacterium]|nr:bifunctional precorrin-2 dehydrogenase/sirohydrochlorin ferrochelatase [Candidatus Omnitrophota bacterium]
MRPKAYYPIFADLSDRPCVVIGGGRVAQRKATTLLSYGARITVISPMLTKRLAACARQGKIRHLTRRFRSGDLRGAWLVYAATGDEQINVRVSRAARRLRIFANVVDQTPLCSFIAPAIFRRGPLTIAVSTAGASPSLAKRMRRELARTIGVDYVPMLRLLRSLRGVAKRKLPSYADRKRYFDRLVSGRTFALVRAGKRRQARAQALSLLSRQTRADGH